MGTTKSGRYLNTHGSKTTASKFAIVHSNEGDFTRSQQRINGKMTIVLRLSNGGHGQAGMDLLDKYGIAYNITKVWSNGVRVGNVPTHMNKKFKAKQDGQSWFPRSWTAKTIRRAGEKVAEMYKGKKIKDGIRIFGVYKGVRVGVIMTKGRIGTIFPDIDQSSLAK